MTNAFKPIITKKGIEHSISTNFDGVNFRITHVSFGGTKFTPTGQEESLLDERLKVQISSSSKINDNAFKIRARAMTDSPFFCQSIAFWSDNILFAVYSSSNLPSSGLFAIHNNSETIVSYTLALEALGADHFEVVVIEGEDMMVELINNHEQDPHAHGLDEIKATLTNISNPDGYKYVGRCKSIEELRAIEPTTNGQRILVDSYYLGGATGGGEFVYDELCNDEDNSGTVITTNSGKCWTRICSNHLTAEEFGARGDGITDDTVALSSFLSEISKKGVRGVLRGVTYKISSSLDISGVDLTGTTGGYNNNESTTIKGSNNHNILEQKANNKSNISYSLRNIALKNGLVGLKMGYSTFSRVEHISILECENGIKLGDPELAGPLWNTFVNCNVKVTNTALDMQGEEWVNANTFINCFFYGNELGGNIDCASGLGAISNKFINTEFSSKKIGIKLHKSKATSFDNCYFESKGPAIWSRDGVYSLDINNCTFGSLVNNNEIGVNSFIHQEGGTLSCTVNAGYIYLYDKETQSNLSFITSANSDGLSLNMQNQPKREIYNVTGFRVFGSVDLPSKFSNINFLEKFNCEITAKNLNLGNATVKATYSLAGSICNVNINMKIGSTTDLGSGQILFKCPIKSSSLAGFYLGNALARQPSSAKCISGTSRMVGGSSYCVAYFNNLNPADSGRPFVWKEGDTLDLAISYNI